METDIGTCFKLVLAQLRRDGFLLESDPKLPSVCTLITGEALRGSWWSHPQAQTIFQVNERLEDHKDVLITKLLAGKVTWVHRKLWPEIFAIGIAREPWQMKQLTASARALIKKIDQEGSLTTDKLSWPRSNKIKPGDAARELEKKLLINAAQFHTEIGVHAKLLETWEHWAKRIGFKTATIPAQTAKSKIEEKLVILNQQFGVSAKLPWQ